MATPITGNRVTIYQEDVAYQRPVSEALLTKLAQASQYANENLNQDIFFSFEGYFRQTSLTSSCQIYVVKNDMEVNHFHMAIGTSGIGTSSLRVKVYTVGGAYAGDLFSTNPSITTTASSDRIYVGSTNSTNLGGISYNSGVLNASFATIPAGYTLSPEIVSNASGALNASLNINVSRV